ncbi:putative lipoprotein [Escherichia coli]|uniref:Putative lipoprotein n=1 Tax=Escherichia coli TaxID=562 RepID=A0A377BKE5_ECOLX|nr:putative lipoprotein [Escherichia coli]
MKKLLLICLPVLLTGCSAFNQLVEHMQTATLEYQCDEKPLTVKLNNPRQEVSFVYDNQYCISNRAFQRLVHVTLTESMFSGRKAMKRLSINATASY